MSLTTTSSIVKQNGDGANKIFAYTFKILNNTDVAVEVGGLLRVITTDYTVDGVGNATGGNITFVTAPASGTNNVVLYRNMPLTQEIDLTEASKFPIDSIEEMFDRNTMQIQQNDELGKRAARAPIDHSLAAFNGEFPDPGVSTNQGKILRLKSDGSGLEWVSVSDLTPGTVSVPISRADGGTGSVNGFLNLVYAKDSADFAAAITAIGANVRTLLITDSMAVTANVTVLSTTTLWFIGEGKLNISAAIVVTINGPIEAPFRQVFTGSGTLTFGNGSIGSGPMREVYPQWWGATGDGVTDDTTAIQAAIDAGEGRIIWFSPGTYMHSGLTVPSGMTLQGSGVATRTLTRLQLITGSEANGLTLQDGTGTIHWTRVLDMQIRGDSAGTIGHGIFVDAPAVNVVVDNVFIRDNAQDGLHVTKAIAFSSRVIYSLANQRDGIRLDMTSFGGCTSLGSVILDTNAGDGLSLVNTSGTAPYILVVDWIRGEAGGAGQQQVLVRINTGNVNGIVDVGGIYGLQGVGGDDIVRIEGTVPIYRFGVIIRNGYTNTFNDTVNSIVLAPGTASFNVQKALRLHDRIENSGNQDILVGSAAIAGILASVVRAAATDEGVFLIARGHTAGTTELGRLTWLWLSSAATDAKARIDVRVSNSQVIMAEFEDTAVNDETALLIRKRTSGASTLQRVTLGATDSGGSGFKLLRVPN